MKISTTYGFGLRGIAIVIAAVALMTLLSACGDSGDSDAIAGVMENVSQQSAEIQALTAQVGSMQSELAEARKTEADNVADLRAGIEELRGQDNMPAEYDDSGLKSEIDELSDAIARLEGRINSIDDEGVDTDALGQELAALSGTVSDLQARMDLDDDDDERIDSEHIESLNAELSSVLAALTELQGSGAASQIDEVLARLDWLETAVAPSYTRAYVEEAILRYNREGRQATLDYYNTPESVNEDLYIFILDEDYKLIAHPTIPANIGLDIRGPLGTDITGKNYGAEFVTVDDRGKWVDYIYLNPAANFTFERKHSWIVRHDNLIFGSGWYERTVSFQSTPSNYVRALVGQAIARYDSIGKDTILSYYNSPASVHGQYYVFAIDADDLSVVASGARPDLVGTVPDRIDPTGYNYTNDIASATVEGGWISYVILNPDTGEQQRKHSWIALHDGLIFGSGWYESGAVTASKDNPPAYVRSLVEEAIARYESDGREAAVDYYNSSESVDGQYYVFAVDADDLSGIANPNLPDYVGRIPARIDPTGYYYGGDLGSATEEGKWISYVIRNPETGVSQRKHTWVALNDGIIWGSGWYEPIDSLKGEPALYVRSLVDEAIDRYEADGLDATVAYYNSEESVDGHYYVFIADENDVMIAHATIPENVGKSADEIISPDGYPAGAQVAAAATEDGAWTSYTYLNPATGNVQTKHSWVIRHDGMVFGSGWYEDGPSKSDAAAYTRAFVERAINLYDDLGLEGTVAYYNSPESVDGQYYVFITDESDVLITHANPDLVGVHLNDVFSPSDGYPAGAQVAAAAVEGGAWTSYTYVNPATGNVETKHSWVIRHDGRVFGSGWYEEGPSKSDPAEYVQSLVQRATNLYDDLGRDATLDYYNTPESADGPWYVFVLEDKEGVLYSVANSNRPDIVGTTRERIDANGFNYGEAIAAVTEEGGGEWIDYLFTHPQTREDAPKHSWVVRRDNLFFGAGWYEGIEE